MIIRRKDKQSRGERKRAKGTGALLLLLLGLGAEEDGLLGRLHFDRVVADFGNEATPRVIELEISLF